ncbi:hypothetical protein Skr01_43310 [Sphaerisporangium krabiense]|nr:hypothetical protein Skr01_43310 [Sphaerisporangium krabiense]
MTSSVIAMANTASANIPNRSWVIPGATGSPSSVRDTCLPYANRHTNYRKRRNPRTVRPTQERPRERGRRDDATASAAGAIAAGYPSRI